MPNTGALCATVLIGAVVSLASCSSDENPQEDAGVSGQSQAGGATSTATGGSSGSGGTVVTTSGGTPSVGGGPSSGTTSAGGAPPIAGAAGAGDLAGSAGTAGSVGMAGSAGMVGTAGTAGTTTGPDALTIACTAVCAAQTGLACAVSDCLTECVNFGLGSDLPALYLQMVQCEAQLMTTAADYQCSDAPIYPLTGLGPAPKVDASGSSACKQQICAYTCSSSFYDGNVCTACNCQFTC